MHLHLVDCALWFMSPLIQFVIAIVMYHRRLHRDYFWFFNYSVLAAVCGPFLWILYGHSYTAYYYAYYVILGLDILPGLGVCQDVLLNAFRFNVASRRLFGILIQGSAAVFAVSLLAAVGRTPSYATDELILAYRGMRYLGCLLLLLLFVAGWRSKLSFKSLPFGIALGYGGFSLVSLFVSLILLGTGMWPQSFLSRLNSFAYLLSTSIWLLYVIWARDPDGNPILPARSGGNAEERSVMYRIVPRGQRFLRKSSAKATRLTTQELGISPPPRSRLSSVPTSRQ